MQKQITSILLVAGTCIGGGTIALPIVLSTIGLIPSLVVMVVTWLLTYYTSLVSVELNLQCDHGLSLGILGRKFSGKCAEIIGELSVKLLSYALLAVFIYGMGSIIQKILSTYLKYDVSSFVIATALSAFVSLILLCPLRGIYKLNNIAFYIFIAIFLILLGVVVSLVEYDYIPWIVRSRSSKITSVISVVFTSFGYQVIFHILRNYLGRDVKMLRRAFLYGSLIPTLVYILWTVSSLSVIAKLNPSFFSQMIDGTVDVGEFVRELANVSSFASFQMLVWWMSIFAIFTSILGVGTGLTESIDLSLQKKISSSKCRKFLATILTITPPYLVAVYVPSAFIKILGVAGIILVVIAILLPIYLFFKANIRQIYLKEVKKWLLIICTLAGIGIMIMEFL